MFPNYLVSILDHPRRPRGSRVGRKSAAKVFRHGGSSQLVLETFTAPFLTTWVSEDDVRSNVRGIIVYCLLFCLP